MSEKIKLLFKYIMFLFFIFALANCKKDDKGFELLQTGSGGASDVDELTITDFVPDSSSAIIEIGQTIEFFVAAQAPIGRSITYTWYIDDQVKQTGVQQRYSYAGLAPEVGNHNLKVVVYDTKNTRTKEWAVKVNGPPVITPISTGIQKVSVDSIITIQSSVFDPNNDTLSYTWYINGVPAPQLASANENATLTGVVSDVGPINITLLVDDGSKTDSYVWSAEVNHFPMACNTLTTGQICTYGGTANIGSDTNPFDSNIALKINPIAHTQDALGNYFLADWDASVIWYWNKTMIPVSRLGVTIPAMTIKVVVGTGELASGPDGIALQSAINRPRGLAFRNSTGTLYVAEYSSHRVRYIDTSGFIYTGLGGGASHVDGMAAASHDCNSPSGVFLYNDDLFVACLAHNRVKKWNLNTDLAYTVYGDGGNDLAGMGGDPLTAGARRPERVFVDSDGLYVTHAQNHTVTFVNLSGAPKTFWAASTPIVIAPNTVNRIIGAGGAGSPTVLTDPQSANIGTIMGITVLNDQIFITQTGNDDNLYLANNTAAPIVISGRTVTPGKILYLNHTSRGYNGSNIAISTARMNDPYYLSVDVLDSTKLVISSLSNRYLREVDLAGDKVNNLLGSGKDRWGFMGDTSKPTHQHLFYYPNGIVFDDSSRSLFFVDAYNYRIRKVDAYGNLETAVARGGGDSLVENDVPSNAYLRTNSSVYSNGLSLLSDNSLLQLNSTGRNLRLWNRSGSNNTYFNVFIQNDRISTVAGDPAGYTNGAGNGAHGDTALASNFNNPSSTAVYNDGSGDRVWIADRLNHCIRELTSTGLLNISLGTCGVSGNTGGVVAEGAVQFNSPGGIAIDQSNGNMIISDRNNHKIKYWNRGLTPVTLGIVTINPGQVGVIACSNGTTGSASENIFASSSRCYYPMGVAVSSTSICFANQYRHNVRCINKTDGRVKTVAGFVESSPRAGSPFDFGQEGISGTSATLYYPSDLSFDANDDLYITDTYNHIIRKLKLSP